MTDATGVQFVKLDDLRAFTAVAGVHMRGVFGEGAMLNLVELEPDALLPLHSHPHEQIGFVVSGTEILEVEGVEHRIGPNEAYVIPGGVEHSGRGGPEGCVLIDVFQPVREDYRAAMDALEAEPRANV
jgi:quercetin dioxygenase-like cupin family protein